MKKFLPQQYSPIAFGFIVSCLMSCMVSGIATYSSIALADEFLYLWTSAWFSSWLIAFPVILFVVPLTKIMIPSVTLDN